jgi:hypothetical protein
MSRRELLQLPAAAAVPYVGRRKKIAALMTTYHMRSLAKDIVTRFLAGYWINDHYYASGDSVKFPYRKIPDNCAWGHGFRNLYVTAMSSVYRIETKVNGTRTY